VGGEGEVAGDGGEPVAEACGVFQVVEVSPGLEEGFLGEVFAGLEVAAVGVGDGTDEGLIAFDDGAVGVAVVIEGTGDEVGVGGGGGWENGCHDVIDVGVGCEVTEKFERVICEVIIFRLTPDFGATPDAPS